MNNKIKPQKYTLAGLLAPGVLLFVFCSIIPLAVAFYFSLFNWDGGIHKTFIGLKNYAELLRDENFWLAFKNNILFVIYAVLGQIGIAFVVAMLLMSRTVRFKTFHRTVIFFPVILSSIVVAYLWQIIYNKDYGLLNKFLELAGLGSWVQPWLDDPKIIIRSLAAPKIWQWIGYYMVILLGAIQNIDPSVLECAELDGANGWRRSCFIVLPMIKNTVVVTVILCISGNMKTFDQIYAMTGGGPGTSSMVVALYAYKMSFVRQRYGYGSACAIGILVLSLLLVSLSRLAGGRDKNDGEV